MPRFTLEVRCESAAFESSTELFDLLHRVAAQVEGFTVEDLGPGTRAIKDTNGNKVGTWRVR